MQVTLFHLMPYADLDMGFREHHRSVWLTLPNSYYDPKKGHRLYNRYLDELELGEELGFDALGVNEHHQNAYGMMPSPVVTAAALARRTSRCKIAILGSAIGLRDHPLTLAEEHAMIDNITGGRLITGIVRGIGAEYYAFGANPALSLERHIEAHDLIVRAWTETGPFAFHGRHYHFDYVNVWPRPYQQPHPPIWCPSQGSVETIEWAAHPDRKYVYLQVFSPFEGVARYLDQYRGTAAAMYGYAAASDRLGWTAPTYVGETDEQAIAEARPHMEALFNVFLPKITQKMFHPPGYLSAESRRRLTQHKRTIKGGQTIQSLMEQGIVIVGGPETVRRRIAECHRRAGFQNFLAMMQFGTLPADLTEKSMRRFAAEVLPAIQALSDRDYRGFDARGAAIR